MAIFGSQWLLIFKFLALLSAVNVSGFKCHVCINKDFRNRSDIFEADFYRPNCGKGSTPIDCHTFAVRESTSRLGLLLSIDQPGNYRDKDVMCVTVTETDEDTNEIVAGATILRGCVAYIKGQPSLCDHNGSYKCTYCNADKKKTGGASRACNSAEEFDPPSGGNQLGQSNLGLNLNVIPILMLGTGTISLLGL